MAEPPARNAQDRFAAEARLMDFVKFTRMRHGGGRFVHHECIVRQRGDEGVPRNDRG
jgi:hypothetical protein